LFLADVENPYFINSTILFGFVIFANSNRVMKGYLLLVLNLIVVASLAQSGSRMTRLEYFDEYKDMAIHEMKRSGVPASITLAQGALESGDGNSRLALQGNNHFGIKCHQDWPGKRIHQDDDEKNECFRKYQSVEDSYRDHSDYLKTKSRYAFLFDLSTTDYKGWARGLQKAGYATSNTYAASLIRIIEEFDLHRYDMKGFSDKAAPKANKHPHAHAMTRETGEINRVKYILAVDGDTYESLTDEMGKLDREIMQYNDAGLSNSIKPGQVIFIQPKRSRAQTGKNIHVLKPGETIYNVSQLYAIKLDRLYELNHLKPGIQPPAGTTLQLRKALKMEVPVPEFYEKATVNESEEEIKVDLNLD